MTGIDTTTTPYQGFERIWFSGAGTGVSADGFNSGKSTVTFNIGAGNGAFPSIVNTLRTTGKLTLTLRNMANVAGSVNFSGTATVKITAETPEPSTIGLFAFGIAAIALQGVRLLRR